MEELEEAIKSLNNHKSPDLDGFTAEYYKKTIEVTKEALLDIINCQMDKVRLIESDKHGATRLGPKVEGVPRATSLTAEAHHIIEPGLQDPVEDHT